MSRVKRFTHSLVSGYLQLVVNSVFTLVSIRLALHYLTRPDGTKPEYGLWMTVTATAGYIAVMDFGLSGAASRILIDYKDHQKPEEYGGIIQTSACVGLAQAGLILLVGTALAFVLGPLLPNIPAELQGEFFWLVIGQCAVTAAMFATRIAALILTANQRFDVCNYSSAVSLVVNCGTMWWGFAHGLGVFSLMWGQAAAVITTLAVNSLCCCQLKLLPKAGQWGRPTWEKFHELFNFGRDVFLYAMGVQFVNFSQTMLLTALIGLDAAATWGVCTRAYFLLVQIISRIFDYSSSALAEMMVRDERDRLRRRFREICILSVNLAVAAGMLLAVCNGPFVQVWLKGKISWPPINDMLVGIWLITTITVKLHTGLVGQAKAFRFLRYLFFIEGLAFIGLTVLLHRFGGITMMLTLSIVCSLCFTFPYGLWRTCEYFHISWSELAGWHRTTLTLAATLAPAGGLVWWFARNLPGLPRLALESSVLGIWSACMFLRYGLDAALRAEIGRRLPAWAGPIIGRFVSQKSEN